MAPRILAGALALVIVPACIVRRPGDQPKAQVKDLNLQGDAKLQWIEKASRALACGQTSLAPDEIEAMAGLSPAEIADKLTKGPRFEATVFDFLRFFHNDSQAGASCGQLITQLGTPQSLAQVQGTFGQTPNYLHAARAVVAGTDFLKVFDEGPYRTIPVMKVNIPLPDPTQPPPPEQTPAEFLAKTKAELLDFVDQTRKPFEAAAAANSNPDVVKACRDLLGLLETGGTDFQKRFDSRINKFVTAAGINALGGIGSDWGRGPINLCNAVFNTPPPVDPPPPEGTPPVLPVIDPKPVIEVLKGIPPKAELAFDIALKHQADVYKPQSFAELEPFDLAPLLFKDQSQSFVRFPYLDFFSLQNSSTNYNRKRSAFMLKTFFCDDLTPVAIVAPDTHASNAHASDPGCQACHYKLDPMAGFFRNMSGFGPGFGSTMNEQGQLISLTFSDGREYKDDELKHYLDTWRAPPEAGHEWNVGYIRSTTKPNLNFYGSTLNDLFAYLKKAPEVRQCIVRRLSQYFVGKAQIFDGGYLDYLGSRLSADGGQTATGVREVIKELITSNTFAHADPDTAKCYDFKPGADAPVLPCEVAWTIDSYCVKCHKNDANGVDLTSWAGDLATGLFRHVDEDGNPITRVQSFTRLKDRLSTPDKTQRMPKNQEMPDADRARLYKWVSAMLDSSGGTPQ